MIARLALFAAAAILTPVAAQEATPPVRGADVAGAWIVDLRISDESAPYTQPMVLNVAESGTVTGEFYNSSISSGRYGRNRGRSCVAFVTSDGVGPYQHAACLVDGRMVGQSWAEHRGFVLPWIAARAAP